MKTHSVCETETLRAEVRALREAVVELEVRLAEFEAEDDDQVWGVWPYNWAVNSWNALKNGAENAKMGANRKKLERHNRAIQKTASERFEGLHLV